MEYAEENAADAEFSVIVSGNLNPGRFSQRYLSAAGDLI